MSASKNCPACQKQWAGTFKFCPEDGALLVAINAADTVLQTPAAPEPTAPFNTQDTVVVAAAPMPEDDRPRDTDEFAKARAKPEPQRESWRSPVAPVAVVEEPVAEAERSNTNPKARKGAARILNLEPVDGSEITTSRDNAEAVREAVAAPDTGRELGLRTAPTIMTPSAAEHMAAESRARQPQAIEPIEPARPARAPAEVKPEPKFERAPAEPQRGGKNKGRAPAEAPRNTKQQGRPPEPTRAAPQRRGESVTVSAPVVEAPKPSLAKTVESSRTTPAKTGESARTAVGPNLAKGGAGPATGVSKRATFSEAAWFMRTEFEVDPETGRVAVGPTDYVLDDSIPEDKRRRFSLGRKGEE